MDTTIRNLDERVYREAKAQAARTGRTIGEVVNEALRAYLGQPPATYGWSDLQPLDFPPGNETLSEEIDAIVYGA